MRSPLKIAVVFATLLMVLPSYADKIKTFWSGTGMTADGPRMIMLQLSEDGTAILQQNRGDNTSKLHAHWAKKGNKVAVSFDPVQGQTTPPPMEFELKKNKLIPQIADNAKMGVYAYPTLQPFGPETVNAGAGSYSCVTGQAGPCAVRETWSSNAPK